ncbi:hypothetical protein AYM39_17020 [Methylomonas sp. DH-1]|nr:hypothetical protein AYM39_17020 [Methylomonas sp. DH-1]
MDNMQVTKVFKAGVVAGLLAMSDASSASVWAPTDNDSQFANTYALLLNIPTGEKFGIFEDTALLSSSIGNAIINPVLSFFDAATVTFTQNGVNVDIKTGNSTGALLGSSNFQLGWWSPTGWITENSSSMISLLGQTSWSLAFVDPTNHGAGNEHRLFAFDIKASQASSDYPGSGGTPAAVPLPATAWFMMTAVLGFLAKGRRKSTVLA